MAEVVAAASEAIRANLDKLKADMNTRLDSVASKMDSKRDEIAKAAKQKSRGIEQRGVFS